MQEGVWGGEGVQIWGDREKCVEEVSKRNDKGQQKRIGGRIDNDRIEKSNRRAGK